MKKPINRAGAAGYRMTARGGRGEIYLYGIIGQDFWGDGVSAKQFADDLKGLGAVTSIDLRINSEGGDVFAGKSMYSLLAEHPARVTVHVDGLAASAASFIAMAGDDIQIAEGAFMMVHNARGGLFGTSEDLRRHADLMDTVTDSIRDMYVARSGKSVAAVKKWMDEETWFTGQQAVDAGLADTVVENLRVAASVRDPSKYRHLPDALLPRRATALQTIAALRR